MLDVTLIPCVRLRCISVSSFAHMWCDVCEDVWACVPAHTHTHTQMKSAQSHEVSWIMVCCEFGRSDQRVKSANSKSVQWRIERCKLEIRRHTPREEEQYSKSHVPPHPVNTTGCSLSLPLHTRSKSTLWYLRKQFRRKSKMISLHLFHGQSH